MSAAPRRHPRARALAAATTAAAALGACLDPTSGPGGATSLRLLALPPSVVVGDTLRDSTGAPTTVGALALDGDDAPVPDAPFRFFYVPLRTDTAARALDSALVVDSVTGLVRAPGPTRQAAQGRIAVRLAAFQLVDTLAIVLRPASLRRTTAGDTLFRLEYVCDDRTGPARADSGAATGGVRIGNVTTALGVTLRADSAGTTPSVPRYLVRYRILSPRPIPEGATPSGQRRPAIYLTGAATDTPLNFDTTTTDGAAGPRLRIVPALLTRAAFPDSVTPLVVRATVLVGRAALADSVDFTVRLQRRSRGLSSGQPLACP